MIIIDPPVTPFSLPAEITAWINKVDEYIETETDEDNLAAWKRVREEAELYLKWALEREE